MHVPCHIHTNLEPTSKCDIDWYCFVHAYKQTTFPKCVFKFANELYRKSLRRMASLLCIIIQGVTNVKRGPFHLTRLIGNREYWTGDAGPRILGASSFSCFDYRFEKTVDLRPFSQVQTDHISNTNHDRHYTFKAASRFEISSVVIRTLCISHVWYTHICQCCCCFHCAA